MPRVINGLELCNGVSKFDGTTWTTYTTKDGLANNWINAIAIDAQGNKWFGTSNGGVSKFDGTNWTTYTYCRWSCTGNSVTAIAIDAQGNKWFGTQVLMEVAGFQNLMELPGQPIPLQMVLQIIVLLQLP